VLEPRTGNFEFEDDKPEQEVVRETIREINRMDITNNRLLTEMQKLREQAGKPEYQFPSNPDLL